MAVKVGDTTEQRVVKHGGSTVPTSTVIIEAIASLEGVDPIDLDVSLYEAVDLDALDALSSDRADDVTVTFVVEEYRVEVATDATVVVERE